MPGEREAIARLTAERDNIRGIADRWRALCEEATSATKVAVARAEAAETENIALRKKLGGMAGAIVLDGWWCLPCGVWNGEHNAKREECRSCGLPKTPAEKGPGQ